MKFISLILKSDEDGQMKTVGRIIFDDKTEKITMDPSDSVLLGRIVGRRLQVEGEFVESKDEPKKFVENLWRQYRSPYLSADKPVQEEPTVGGA